MESIDGSIGDPEKLPFKLVVDCDREHVSDILSMIEKIEGSRIRRIGETNKGAVVVDFLPTEKFLQDDLRRRIWEIDRGAIIRDNIDSEETVI